MGNNAVGYQPHQLKVKVQSFGKCAVENFVMGNHSPKNQRCGRN